MIVATLAPIFSSIQLLPQLYKTYTTKSVHDLSYITLLIILLSNILWLLHGYFIQDFPLLLSGILGAIVNMTLLVLFCIYSMSSRY